MIDEDDWPHYDEVFGTNHRNLVRKKKRVAGEPEPGTPGVNKARQKKKLQRKNKKKGRR